MPRYIDAEPFKGMSILKPITVAIEGAPNTKCGSFLVEQFAKIKDIDDIPTADVQEVIRCKNCKFFDPYDKVEDFDGQCVVRDCETDKEEFCSYGAKRGDEK